MTSIDDYLHTPVIADGASNLTGSDCRDAALVICGRARGTADARQLLEICGLIPRQDRRTTWPQL